VHLSFPDGDLDRATVHTVNHRLALGRALNVDGRLGRFLRDRNENQLSYFLLFTTLRQMTHSIFGVTMRARRLWE
jgi:hypothetical protein